MIRESVKNFGLCFFVLYFRQSFTIKIPPENSSYGRNSTLHCNHMAHYCHSCNLGWDTAKVNSAYRIMNSWLLCILISLILLSRFLSTSFSSLFAFSSLEKVSHLHTFGIHFLSHNHSYGTRQTSL